MELYKPSRQDKRLCSGNAVLRLFTNFSFCFLLCRCILWSVTHSWIRALWGCWCRRDHESCWQKPPPGPHAITHSTGVRRKSLKWYNAQLWGYPLRFSTYTQPCWGYHFLKAPSSHLYSLHPMLNQPFFRKATQKSHLNPSSVFPFSLLQYLQSTLTNTSNECVPLKTKKTQTKVIPRANMAKVSPPSHAASSFSPGCCLWGWGCFVGLCRGCFMLCSLRPDPSRP